jgi:hypothetical protein
MSFKVFEQNAILTAAQVNEFLMEQAVMRFDDLPSLNAAFSSEGASPAQGMVCVLADNRIYVYTGASWVPFAFYQEGVDSRNAQIWLHMDVS